MELRLKDCELNPRAWQDKGYQVPQADMDEIRANTSKEPTWIHFGAGNIFRAFPAAVLQDAINFKKTNKGVIVAESFDYDIIDKAYVPYNNMSLVVILKADGTIDKKIVSSVTESVKADADDEASWNRMIEIFRAPSLQMASFTITEKGYSVKDNSGNIQGIVQKDFEDKTLKPHHAMGKAAALLLERYNAGELPIAMVSMDNCSHNGDKLFDGIMAYVDRWVADGVAPEGFKAYVTDDSKVSFTWSMIDKITPRPDDKVRQMLQDDGFVDTDIIITDKHTYTAPFVNAEEAQYLVIEDKFPNGRPPLEVGGVIFTDRETVDRVEKMKVCTCLNPLHTALAIYGCLMGYDKISEEMKDDLLKTFVTRMGNDEGMPVVVNPGIVEPQKFLDEVLTKRLPNPFMPDTPQRIATDTSQKLPIRFGETIKAYGEKDLDINSLKYIPLVIAGYARYLMGVDDEGETFELSPDPFLEDLQKYVSGIKLGDKPEAGCLKELLTREDIFGVDLYKAGLGEKIEGMFAELVAGKGAIRETLQKYEK